MPRWDAPADPQIVSIEASPKNIQLETAADFHRVIAIVRMKDESTHDVTKLAKCTLEEPSIAKLDGSRLTPVSDAGFNGVGLQYGVMPWLGAWAGRVPLVVVWL